VAEAVAVRVRDALASATAALADAGCESPRLDAELLLARVLGHDSRARLVLDADAVVGRDDVARYERLLGRRGRREPVAYILGVRAFRGITLSVDRRVLIPRPETELLVQVALELPRGCAVADVGTGSGAVALALKTERPDLVVSGLDIDRDALAVARSNRARLRLSEVEFVCADLTDGDRYDAVLANLPYVRAGEELAPEIALYEPRQAVYGGGDDGLEAIRRLASELVTYSRARVVALEVGAGQAESVAGIVRNAGFVAIETHRDLAGHERVVVGRR
jgi:release factor glutamine methyltransferase